MVTSIDEAVLIKRAYQPQGHLWENTDALRESLSDSDIASYRAFHVVFYPFETEWGSAEHRLNVAAAFKSPAYSDAVKEYFAAAHLNSEFILLSADGFLTEKVILSFVKSPSPVIFNMSYFAALMGSSHLSEQIVLKSTQYLWASDGKKALHLIPDRMITSEVMSQWLSKTHRTNNLRCFAARRIKQAHPEYEEFPDDWVMKVFCGE